jgi:hypothetical protein
MDKIILLSDLCPGSSGKVADERILVHKNLANQLLVTEIQAKILKI